MSFTQGLNVTDYALGTVSLSKQIYCCHMTQRLLKNGPYVARVKASIKIGTVLPQSDPVWSPSIRAKNGTKPETKQEQAEN